MIFLRDMFSYIASMESLKFLFGSALLLFGIFIIFTSYVRHITNHRNRNKKDAPYSSPAPIVGPLFVIVGYTALPFEFSNWIFLVILLDPDTLITLVGLPYLIKAFRE